MLILKTHSPLGIFFFVFLSYTGGRNLSEDRKILADEQQTLLSF